MNILIVTPNFPSSVTGSMAAKFVYVDAKAYVANGAKVKVITPIYPGAPAYEKFEDNLEVERFSYFIPARMQRLVHPQLSIYRKKPWYYYLTLPFFALFFFIAVFRRSKWADIIICQWTPTFFFAWPSKLIYGKPILIFIRGSDVRIVPHFINRFIFRNSDAAIDGYGPNKENNSYKKRYKANYLVLPSIIDTSATSVTPPDLKAEIINAPNVFKIMHVGRFDQFKMDYYGVPLLVLIEAAKILKDEGRKFHIWYIGDGEPGLYQKATNRVSELKLQDEVTFLGFKTNVENYIKFADIGVGGVSFNTVSQEFSVLGKPQMLVKGGVNEETPWVHKENVIFFEKGNAQSLAKGLAYAIDNPSELSQLSERAREMTSNYILDLEGGGTRHLNAFKEFLTKNGST